MCGTEYSTAFVASSGGNTLLRSGPGHLQQLSLPLEGSLPKLLEAPTAAVMQEQVMSGSTGAGAAAEAARLLRLMLGGGNDAGTAAGAAAGAARFQQLLLGGAGDAGTTAGSAAEAARLQQLMLEGAATRADDVADADDGGDADDNSEDGSHDEDAFVARADNHIDLAAIKGAWSDRRAENNALLKETIYSPRKAAERALSGGVQPPQAAIFWPKTAGLRRRKGFHVDPDSF
jgi:hypothetical protein